MNLLQALRMTSPTASPASHQLENGRGGSRPGAIAIVGSGGKTTAEYKNAAQNKTQYKKAKTLK